MTLTHMMLQDEPLDYEALVAEYNQNLFLVLRGHRSAEYLDTWVPDEDPLKGVLNMLEAAELTGTGDIAIRLGEATLRTLDQAALATAAAHIGRVEFERTGSHAVLRVSGIGGLLAAGSDGDLFEATVDGVTLAARIGPGATIAQAAHRGAETPAGAAVLDAFCAELAGLTVQEAAEHGVIRLEFRLRADARLRPVPGIVLPGNADPVFALPARLIRALAAAYCERTGTAFAENSFTRRVDAAWLHLTEAEKLARLNAELEARIGSLGLADGDVRVIAVDQEIRVTVAFRETVPVAEKPRFLRAFEHVLHAALEPSLQVFMSDIKDGNALRRL